MRKRTLRQTKPANTVAPVAIIPDRQSLIAEAKARLGIARSLEETAGENFHRAVVATDTLAACGQALSQARVQLAFEEGVLAAAQGACPLPLMLYNTDSTLDDLKRLARTMERGNCLVVLVQHEKNVFVQKWNVPFSRERILIRSEEVREKRREPFNGRYIYVRGDKKEGVHEI